MKTRLMIAAAFATSLMFASTPAQAEVSVGDQAPEFELVGSDGKTYTNDDLEGKVVVIAWYPKAFTGG